MRCDQSNSGKHTFKKGVCASCGKTWLELVRGFGVNSTGFSTPPGSK